MASGPEGTYDAILVGSSFASSFFLLEYLKHAKPDARVLVLERGELRPHAWRLTNREQFWAGAAESFVNRNPKKEWTVSLVFGGNSNCWWGNTPRFLPEDFRLKSTYGVGADWPLTYDELEGYYAEVEEVMQISGPDDGSPFPRSRPYPLPPHRFNTPEERLKKAFPTQFFHVPTARPSAQTQNRPRCCGNGVCDLCPIDSKFTILNELQHLYRDPRVTLELGARAHSVETAGGRATGVAYEKGGKALTAKGDLVGLGTNAIFNPHLLLRSGIEHPRLGKGLHEQVGVHVTVLLDGLDGLDGSTSLTGHGYMLYGGERRRDRAGVLLETQNMPWLRDVRGRWRQVLHMKAVVEDFPLQTNYVAVSKEDPTKPETVWLGSSPHADRAVASLAKDLEPVLKALPVESVRVASEVGAGESHIVGTTVMGADPAESIVDRHLVHHRIRNLVVLGSGVFPSSTPANPTLTLSALSLWSARHLVGSA